MNRMTRLIVAVFHLILLRIKASMYEAFGPERTRVLVLTLTILVLWIYCGSMQVQAVHDGGDCGPKYLTYEVKVTHYCPCVRCCGKSDGITALGVVARSGTTVAGWRNLVLTQPVYIDGQRYIVQDRGGAIKEGRIDIYCDTHAEALKRGTYTTTLVIRRK